MDPFDLSFVEWSLVRDDPKLWEQIQNRYYDPEFDAWMEEFDKEQQQQHKPPTVEMPDAETVNWSTHRPPKQATLPTEEYEVGDTSQFGAADWEREE